MRILRGARVGRRKRGNVPLLSGCSYSPFFFATVSFHNRTLSALLSVRSPNSTRSTFKMEFDLGGRCEIPCHQELYQPARLRTALKKDCLDFHEDWMRLTLQKVMGSGWIYAGFVNPDIENRHTHCAHFDVLGYMGTVDISAAYLSARAQISDAIPRSIIQEMQIQGYDFIGWDRIRKGLVSHHNCGPQLHDRPSQCKY